MSEMLLEGAAAMGFDMTEAQAEQFAAYHELLKRANERMNLTRVPDDPAEVFTGEFTL